MCTETFLFVGLGNPGEKYEKTRHNLGFRVVGGIAEKRGWNFQSKRAFKGKLASGRWCGKAALFLLPTTYMNASGKAVAATCRYYGVPLCQMVVVTDDVALAMGTLRYRPGGSSGGHNGLKSIQDALGTAEYPRLRIGVNGPQGEESLSSYVLARFAQSEEEILQRVVERAEIFLERWLVSEENERKEPSTVTAIEKKKKL